MLKRFISLILSVLMICSIFLGSNIIVTAADISYSETGAYSGLCGLDVRWSLNTISGTLTITGTGEMQNYTATYKAPWYNYRKNISMVIIQTSVESIGNRAFYSCVNLKNIEMDYSVKTIGDEAFLGCSSLESIILPRYLKNLGKNVFPSEALKTINVSSLSSYFRSVLHCYNTY